MADRRRPGRHDRRRLRLGASGPAASSDPGAKIGGKPGPIAITVADSQPPGKPSNLPLAEFERQVETLSGGSMTVTILTQAVDDVTPVPTRPSSTGQERHVPDGRRPGPGLVRRPGSRASRRSRRRSCSSPTSTSPRSSTTPPSRRTCSAGSRAAG